MENDDYSTQFMTEVHNSMQVVDVPKKRPWKVIVLIAFVVLVVVAAVIVGIILVNKNASDQRLAQFAEDERAMVEETIKVLSDPVFSLIPYYDDDNGFYACAVQTSDHIQWHEIGCLKTDRQL